LGNDGVFVVMSAGNEGGNVAFNLPGNINGKNLFTVGSINSDGAFAGYSNSGSGIDYLTIGTRIFSSWKNGEYRMVSGTSMACAVLSGIIHARGGLPATSGSLQHNGITYPIGAVK
jgi:hypothetical protein